MITSYQMKAARIILGLDQRELAVLSELSLPTIQRMESSKGIVKGNIDTLVKLIKTFENAGVELIAENLSSIGQGRGVRLIEPSENKNEEK
jgi:predicted transcriptional regulator